jgi:hypothetical protein
MINSNCKYDVGFFIVDVIDFICLSKIIEEKKSTLDEIYKECEYVILQGLFYQFAVKTSSSEFVSSASSDDSRKDDKMR